jgi:hypothetical protein
MIELEQKSNKNISTYLFLAHLFNIHNVSDTDLNTSQILIHLIHITLLWGRSVSSHFIDLEIEAK